MNRTSEERRARLGGAPLDGVDLVEYGERYVPGLTGGQAGRAAGGEVVPAGGAVRR